MRRWLRLVVGRLGRAMLAAATLPGIAQAQSVERGTPRLSLGELHNELKADARVGSKRAGLICAPAGGLRWREVEPKAAAARVTMARALRDAGAAVDGPTEDWLDYRSSATGYRLVGAIAGLDMRACLPSYGAARLLGGRRRLKGDGTMMMEWRIYRLADRQMVASTRTCASFVFDGAGLTLAEAAELGAAENARLVGRELARATPAFVLPARLGLADEQCHLGDPRRNAEPRRGDSPD